MMAAFFKLEVMIPVLNKINNKKLMMYYMGQYINKVKKRKGAILLLRLVY
jgi:hypothetical protein